MPLTPELAISETTRLTNMYAVSFFDETLKHHGELRSWAGSEERQGSPLVRFVADCDGQSASPRSALR
jgi:hypothetical protein